MKPKHLYSGKSGIGKKDYRWHVVYLS
jgi:hypothetical protein